MFFDPVAAAIAVFTLILLYLLTAIQEKRKPSKPEYDELDIDGEDLSDVGPVSDEWVYSCSPLDEGETSDSLDLDHVTTAEDADRMQDDWDEATSRVISRHGSRFYEEVEGEVVSGYLSEDESGGELEGEELDFGAELDQDMPADSADEGVSDDEDDDDDDEEDDEEQGKDMLYPMRRRRGRSAAQDDGDEDEEEYEDEEGDELLNDEEYHHKYPLRKRLRRQWTHHYIDGSEEKRLHRKPSPYKE